jgi:methylmalonyl-CoA decarboxylase
MPTVSVIQMLTASIAPVIVISGVGLLLLGITNRYGRVIDRTRLLVRDLAESDPESARRRHLNDQLRFTNTLRRVEIKESPTPIIAMVEGGVWGGACEVVMSCDIVIAAEGTTFAITPAKLGVPYDIEGTLSFMQSVSLPVIKEMLFTAQPMPADRALRVGLINQVVSSERLESATTEMAGHMIQNSPLVISLLKEQLRVLGEAHPLNPEGFQRIQAIRRRIYDSADYQEGIQAFFERRAPQFEGR